MPGALARSATVRDIYGNVQQDGPFTGEAITIVSASRTTNAEFTNVYAITSAGVLECKPCSHYQLDRMHMVHGMGSPPPKSAWRTVQ